MSDNKESKQSLKENQDNDFDAFFADLRTKDQEEFEAVFTSLDYETKLKVLNKLTENSELTVEDIMKVSKEVKKDVFNKYYRQFIQENEKVSITGMECAGCGGIAKERDLEFKSNRIDGWKCDDCGMEYFNPEQAQEILKKNKNEKLALEYAKGEIDEDELREMIKNKEDAEEIIFIVKHLKKGKEKIEEMISRM